jgi:hypothetical protein
MSVRAALHRARGNEDGAILPLVAILLIVLMGFAAFGVDVAGAYASRTHSQSAADAGVLGAALEYLSTDSPTGQDLAAIAKSYVATNLPDRTPSDTEWEACLDPDKPVEYAPLLDTSAPLPYPVISDCISLKQIDGEPALLRVRLPTYDMPTAFASVLGVDTMAVSAIATAELRYNTNSNILPTSLPNQPGLEECLGTPPKGHLPLDPVVCGGAISGNFGLVDSPWFGADEPHYTNAYPSAASTDCDDRTVQSEAAKRGSHSYALGLDHLITTHPDAATLPPGVDEGINGQAKVTIGADDCSAPNKGALPYILLLNTGTKNNRDATHNGLVGGQGVASVANTDAIGRLRQPSSPGSSMPPTVFDTSGADFKLDNVGLWEYLDASATLPSDCQSIAGADGRGKTNALINCLNDSAFPSDAFTSDLLASPRFAVVPVLNYDKCTEIDRNNCKHGKKWWAILEMRPVYIQSSWFDCTASEQCLFQPDDFLIADPPNPDEYSGLWNPGESKLGPCVITDGPCEAGPAILDSKFKLLGVTAIVLDWTELPADAENQYGSSAPFEVFLHNNE